MIRFTSAIVATGRIVALGALTVLCGAGCLTELSRKPVQRQITSVEDPTEEAETVKESREERIEALEDKLASDSQNPKWHYELGFLYEETSELGKAELYYRSGLGLVGRGEFTGPHLYLGRVLLRRGAIDEAIAQLETVVNIRPTSKQGYFTNEHYRDAQYMLGLAHYQAKREESSRTAFRRYLRLGGQKSAVVRYFPELVAAG